MCFIQAFALQYGASSYPQKSDFYPTPSPPPHNTVQTLDPVKETLRLLREGDRAIDLRPEYSDIILVVGNTGAGKSTIAKFLTTNCEDMEAYETRGNILIRDRAVKISQNTTVLSKIVPNLMIYDGTHIAFYDLPGFSDTQHETIEIAKAFFMRKVAEHAKRVKIVFIVKHYSLRNGHPQRNFKGLIKAATDFVKNTRKYAPAISLIVSKTEGVEGTDQQIIDWIGGFISNVKHDIPGFISGQAEQRSSENLLDAFLHQDRDSMYDRISFFRQPTQIGPLNQDFAVQSRKAHMEQMIFNRTQFVPTAKGDFGLSVSNKAIHLVKSLAPKVKDDITLATYQLADLFRSHYDDKLASIAQRGDNNNATATTQNILKELTSQHRILGILTKALSKISDRTAFFLVLQETLPVFKINGTSFLISSVLSNNRQLEFFEQILGEPHPARTQEWLRPLEQSTVELRNKVWNLAKDINLRFISAVKAISEELLQALIREMRAIHQTNSHSDPNTNGSYAERVYESLSQDFSALTAMTTHILSEKNVKSCIQTVFTNVAALNLMTNVTTPPFLTPLLTLGLLNDVNTDDTIDGQVYPFQPEIWVKPLEKFLLFLQGKILRLSLFFSEEKSKASRQEMEDKMNFLKAEMNRTAAAAADRARDFEQKSLALQGNFTSLQQDLTKLHQIREKERQDWEKREKMLEEKANKQLEEERRVLEAEKNEREKWDKEQDEREKKDREERKKQTELTILIFFLENSNCTKRNLSLKTYNEDTNGSRLNMSSRWLDSINTQGTCVRLYPNQDCHGNFAIVEPGTHLHNDVRKLFMGSPRNLLDPVVDGHQ